MVQPLPPDNARVAGPWFVYLIECADGSLYAGITTSLARRLAEHNLGRASKYTRGRRPVRLVHAEPYADRAAASQREHAVKRLSRARKEALLTKANGAAAGAAS
jgi:putative endonuclease